MKKLITIFLLLITAATTFAQKPKVVVTASMMADMAKNIGGDKIEVECIVPIGGDPHLHEPTPRDARLVTAADIIFKNGLTFEGWLNKLIDNAGTNAKVVLVTKGIEAISSTIYQDATDPHAWMVAENGVVYCENILKALKEYDSKNAEYYQARFDLYKSQLQDLEKYIKKKIQTIPEKQRILITSHDAFQYYGRHYGLRLESVLGTSTDADVQTSDVQRLNTVVKESGVPALFVESTINPKLMQQIAADNDVEVGGELFADSLGDEESDAPTYIAMLRHNTDTIVKALTRQKVSEQKEKPTNYSNWFIIAFIAFLMIGGFIFVAKKVA